MFDRMFLTLQMLRGDIAARLGKDEEGATAVEYGLMVAAIAAVIIVAVIALGGNVNTAFEYINTQWGTIGN